MKTHNKRITKRKLKRRVNTRKRGGGGNLSSMTAAVLFTFLTFAVANSNSVGKHYYMTACAGNTCRSPQAEYMIKSLVDDPNLVSSFGVNVRAPGSSMAPLTKQIATDLCEDNETCIESVNNHKSKQFDYALVKQILEDPNNTLQILPMDDKTADSIFDILQKYDFDKSELSRIHVGADCDKNGECRIKSADAPDPYFDKGTWREPGSYANASSTITDFIENDVMRKTSANPKKWIPDGNNIRQKNRYQNQNNRYHKNSGR
jgi:protein-tyrosine-phosphatase